MEVKLTIAICTYNRCRYLVKCIDALLIQDLKDVEILIIDNGSTDTTREVANKIINPYKNIRYIVESQIGLSYARNRAIYESSASWVLYLDDDSIPSQNSVERALFLCHLDIYDCIGGIYKGYFETEKPKWIRSDIGDKVARFTSIYECPHDEPHGGVVLYRISALQISGNFNTSLGMSEKKIAFDEETELQFRLERNGFKLAIDPLLNILHLNKVERYSLRTMLFTSFYHGRDSLYKGNFSLVVIIYLNLKSFIALIILRIPKSLFNLIFNTQYYIQNMFIDCLNPNIFYLGRLVSKIKLIISKYN